MNFLYIWKSLTNGQKENKAASALGKVLSSGEVQIRYLRNPI